MKTLHIRGVPGELHKRLKLVARMHNRSLSAQVVMMLSDALDEEEFRLRQIGALRSIRRRRFKPPAGAPTSQDFLREDRSQ